MKPIKLVLTCEHGGNDVPESYRALFKDHETILNSNQAQDIGAGVLADHLHNTLSCDYVKSTVTRLLIDCNRKLTHPDCFSKFTHHLSITEKQQLINNYYLPFRNKVAKIINDYILSGYQVLHVSVHSFIPEIDGIARNAAVSLLYDSSHHGEKEVARIWRNLISGQPTHFRVRVNYPYKGSSDNFTATFRKKYSEQDYLGIELECNQALLADEVILNQMKQTISNSLIQLIEIL